MQRWTEMPSPLGALTLTGSADGALSGLFMSRHRHRPALAPGAVRDDGAFADAVGELEQYFAGERRTFDVPIDLDCGSAFQRRVWAALRQLPYGTTTTYGELAARLGLPGGARAVGLANGRNPISIVVPCHRVLGAGGALTGYGGGTARKRALLELEGALAPAPAALPLALAPTP